jgi:CelD/BcsL family acetyltransferase involved in cellulose biosynthesis
MEDYFSALSKNERKNRRKYELRALRGEYSVSVDSVSDEELLAEEFEQFALQHANLWAPQGKPGHFGAWPRALDFNRALVKAQGRHGRVRFLRILADGKVISSQYTFSFGDAYYWELPARSVEKEWERFSLGPTGIVQMIEAALKEGKRRIEGGLAHYDYKLRLNAKEYAVATFRFVADTPASRFRFRAFRQFHKLFRIAYHKLWYQRILPSLPGAFSRSQSGLWLRMDF